MTRPGSLRALASATFLISLCLILYELLLTRLFSVVLFAQFAHLALALALLGIGVGAIAQHLRPSLVPAEGTQPRVAWLALLMAVAMLLAVWAAVTLPVIQVADVAPSTYQERSSVRDELLRPGLFSLLLPILAAPFVCAGLVFSGLFQRLRQQIGLIYGADLLGGAIGAVLFIPALSLFAGPDTVFSIMALAALAALLLFRAAHHRVGAGAALAILAASLLAMGASRANGELLTIRHAAGYSDELVTYVEWTPLTRLALHERGDTVQVLLDNSSASEVVLDADCLRQLAWQQNRSLVYRLHSPPARVAIMAAAAGPEVAVAQSLGYRDIDAIDIASQIFDLVAERFPDNPYNPYVTGNTRRIHADGRAAILQAHEPYDIIQMVHANLWSAAGLLANAWSPSLLETKEAFSTYLDHLTPDGTLSFARGPMSTLSARAAAEALRERGVDSPYRHIIFVEGNSTLVLIKPRPWTPEEVHTVNTLLIRYPKASMVGNPTTKKPSARIFDMLNDEPLMTDNRPYLDTAQMLPQAFEKLFQTASGETSTPLGALYSSIVLQASFVLLMGLIFVLLPLLSRGRTELDPLRGTGGVLLYVAGLGYGYLAVETILVHELVLFVGHPTYAVTVVILALLLSSGLGSVWSSRLRARGLGNLRLVLLGVLGLGLLQAWVVPPLLHATALDLPIALRISTAFLVLLPLGFFMGIPFPLAMAILPDFAHVIVPWAWAINSWMSVASTMTTILISRIYGYSQAFCVALLAYGIAFLLAGRLTRVRCVTHTPPTTQGSPLAG